MIHRSMRVVVPSMMYQKIISAFVVMIIQSCWTCEGFVPATISTNIPIATSKHRSTNYLWSNNDQEVKQQQQQQNNNSEKETFWNSQKELANALSIQAKASLRQEQSAKFEKRQWALVTDTAYITWFIFCLCWMVFPNPMIAISYIFGASMGTAYTYGLGKSVEVLGQSVDDVGATQGAGVGGARFAFLILLFLFVGKFRGGEFGLQEIPSIAGFFTYQIASLKQGLREIND